MSTKAVEQLTVTVPQAARMLGIGRTKAFQMARDGELRIAHVCKGGTRYAPG